MIFSRSDVVDMIFSTVDWDAARGGHTVETLLHVLQATGVTSESPKVKVYAGFTKRIGETWTPTQVRLIIAGLLQSGELDMRSNGVLIIPEATPDPLIERFNGAWYVTKDGHVQGPYSEGKAKSVAAIHS